MQRTVQRISILVAALLPIVILGVYVLQPKTPPPETAASVVAVTQTASTATEQTTTPTTKTTTTASTPSFAATSPTTTTPTYAYKDGTYSLTTAYRVPEASAQKLGVELTIVHDVVTAATVTNMATEQTSSMYQNAFMGGYKTSVVGKSIASLQIGKVSGSSLTTAAFNDALTAIQKQAAI